MTSTAPFAGWLDADPEIKQLLDDELTRQRTTLQLIASENFTSPAVLAASGSVLTNKTFLPWPARRIAVAHATEVLPTPPFWLATTSTRMRWSDFAGTADTGSRAA